MEEMRAEVSRQLQSDVPAVAEMTEHLTQFQGKQLRAALVLLSASASDNAAEELPNVAAVVELIHLATLVHDDVLDGAKIRRRVECVNERWDNQVAVLLGDFLYARAFHLSTTLSSPLASQLLATITQQICAGEIEQAASRYAFDMSVSDYERIAGAKTAVLYGAACELGERYGRGETAGGPSELGAFGREVGLAFQIVDDILDVEGTATTLGKSVGKDAGAGKPTYPALHGLTRSRALASEAAAAAGEALARVELGGRLSEITEWVISRRH